MMSPVGLTSRWVAASRALETELATPLFHDPYARALAGPEGFQLFAECERLKAGWSSSGGPDLYLSIRTRYFDDALLECVTQSGIRQVVLLAAGMDTRAFRLPWPAGVTVYELDRFDVHSEKQSILEQTAATATCDRRVVVANLESEWGQPLLAAGFNVQHPAAFLVEGLFIYLDHATVDAIFAELNHLATPESWLGADVVNPEFLSSPFVQPLREKMETLGCPWQCGITDPEDYFAQHGWQASVVMPGESTANYHRWPYRVLPRHIPGASRSFFVTARRAE